METDTANPIKAAYFDLANTLIYYPPPWPNSFEQFADPVCNFLHQNGFAFEDGPFQHQLLYEIVMHEPAQKENYRERTASQVMTGLLHDLGYTHFDEAFVHQTLRVMYDISEKIWKPEPDALEILRTLQAKGVWIGLISNAPDDENVQNLIDMGGFRPYLDLILSSAAFGYGKPSPDIFNYALDALGVTASEAVMVGDTLRTDILGANQSGMRSIWITRRAKHVDPPISDPAMRPWKTTSNLLDLADIILTP